MSDESEKCCTYSRFRINTSYHSSNNVLTFTLPRIPDAITLSRPTCLWLLTWKVSADYFSFIGLWNLKLKTPWLGGWVGKSITELHSYQQSDSIFPACIARCVNTWRQTQGWGLPEREHWAFSESNKYRNKFDRHDTTLSIIRIT